MTTLELTASPSTRSVVSMQRQSSLGYMPAMDGLRAIAVLIVYVFHAATPLATGGFIGVDIFFVVSGFLITSLLIKEWDRFARINFKNFYMRRALRLLPALLALLLVYLIATQTFLRGVIPGVSEKAWGDVLIVLVYVSNWTRALGFSRPNVLGHAWSLSVEEQFYMLWPPLLLLCLKYIPSRRNIAALAVGGCCLVTLHRLHLVYQGAGIERLSTGLDTHLDGILLGCALGVLFASHLLPTGPQMQKIAKILAWVSVGILVILNFTIGFFQLATYTIWLSVVNLCTCLLLFHLIISPQSLLKAWLSYKPFVYIGKISYGIYLYHFPLLYFLGALGFHNWTRLVFIGPMTLLVSILSYEYLETPFLKLKTRFNGLPG